MPTLSRNWRLVLSAFLGIALPWIPGLWLPGMFAAAIWFREGIHSNHPEVYFILALVIDCLLYAGLTYYSLTMFFRTKIGSKSKHESQL
jgi:uncharacterized protein YqgC (DUF456 family)